jgi:hypothetical protein
MAGAERPPPASRLTNGVVLSLFAVPVAIGLVSILHPLNFANAVSVGCGWATFLCAPASLYNEAEQMKSLGFEDYGVGLQAFRRLGVVLTGIGVVALVTLHFATGAAKRKLDPMRFIPAIQPLDIPIGLAGMGFVIWWTLLAPDIYLGGSQFVKVGPPVGTIAFASAIAFSSMIIGLGAIYALRYTFLRETFPPSGSAAANQADS